MAIAQRAVGPPVPHVVAALAAMARPRPTPPLISRRGAAAEARAAAVDPAAA